MDDGFRLEHWIDGSGTVHIEVAGDLDMATADRLPATLTAYRPPPARCVIDLSECHFVDSSGLRAMLRCRLALDPPNQVALVGLRPAVERALQVAHMQSMFELQPVTPQEARIV
jgi:anti-anti-sigma factor